MNRTASLHRMSSAEQRAALPASAVREVWNPAPHGKAKPSNPGSSFRDSLGAGRQRILFVTPYYKPYLGGIERSIEQLASQLVRQGHRVGVLTTSFAFPRSFVEGLPDREVMDGVEVFRVPGWPHRAPPFFSVPLIWFPPRVFRNVVRQFQPDIVHWVGDGWFWAHFWTWYYGKRRTGFVFTPSFHRLRPAYRWLQPINMLLCRVVDRAVVLSSKERRDLRRTYLVPSDHIEQIGWGSDANTGLDHAPRGWSPDAMTILCVGRLGLHKGQEWLLDRIVSAQTRISRPVRLVLVGRDEGGEKRLRDRIRRNDLADLVLMTGEVDDEELNRWYGVADLFVLFSRYEAWGLVFVEAMSHGVPVLTHDVGAVAETVGEGGIVVPRFDEEAAESALVALIENDALRLSLSRKARVQASTCSWSEVGRRYLETYRVAQRGKTPWPEQTRTGTGERSPAGIFDDRTSISRRPRMERSH